MIHVCEKGLYILTWSTLNLLPRTLAVINAKLDLKGKSQDQKYKVKSNSFLSDEYWNVVLPPRIYVVIEHVSTVVPVV